MSEAPIQDAFLRAVYSLTHDGERSAFTFVRSSIPGSDRIEIALDGAWAIIAAGNPMSRRLDDAANSRRDDELAGALQKLQLPRGPAEGRSPDGSWREASRIVLGIDRAGALALGRRFEQRAVIWSEGGRVGVLDCRTERWSIRPIYGVRGRRLVR